MKKIIKMISVIVVSCSSLYVTAQVEWVQTPFWKAPISRGSDVFIDGLGNLSEDCARFQKLIYTPEGTLRWVTKYPEKVDRLRSTIDPALFQIQSDTTLKKEEQTELSLKDEESSLLPYFNQTKAITVTSLSKLSDFEVISKEGSLTHLSKSLGLKDSPLEVMINVSGSLVLDIKGLDLACDLLNGNAYLEATSLAYVYLPEQESIKINHFYNSKLLPQIRSLFGNDKTTRIARAARLGFRLGFLLESEEGNQELVQMEKKIEALYRILFLAESLMPSKHVVEVGGKKMVHIESSSSEFPKKVILRVQK